MDIIECKICNIQYDEEEHKPRHAPCGHEWCSACIRALIKNLMFECPKCRQKKKVVNPDDLPVSFGLIDVVRAFKNQNLFVSKESKPEASGSSSDDACKVHLKKISHRCLTCKRWSCLDCLDTHTSDTGCSTVTTSEAIIRLKEDNIKDFEKLLCTYEDDVSNRHLKIQEHSGKRKVHLEKAGKHNEEIKKINSQLEQWKKQKVNAVKSKENLSQTNTPYAVMDNIEILDQMKQSLRSWSVKNMGNNSTFYLSKTFEGNKYVYVEMAFRDEKRHGKLSQNDADIYFHTLQTKAVPDGSICMPIARFQKLIPNSPSLVFMELNLGGKPMGRVLLRLKNNLPNIREHMEKLFTGQDEKNLIGIGLYNNDSNGLKNLDLKFNDRKVTPDSNASGKSILRGDLVAGYRSGYLYAIRFQVKKASYGSGDIAIGSVETGMDIIQECYDNHSKGVLISDCSLVMEKI